MTGHHWSRHWTVVTGHVLCTHSTVTHTYFKVTPYFKMEESNAEESPIVEPIKLAFDSINTCLCLFSLLCNFFIFFVCFWFYWWVLLGFQQIFTNFQFACMLQQIMFELCTSHAHSLKLQY